MSTPPSQQSASTAAPGEFEEALAYFQKRRAARGYRTIILQAHNPSWRKVQNIIWAAKHRQNLIHSILEHLREDTRTPRHDGAFAVVRTMLLMREEMIRAKKRPGKPLTLISDMLEQRFPASNTTRRKQRKLHLPALAQRNRFRIRHTVSARSVAHLRLQVIRARRWRPILLAAADYPIPGSLRKGAIRACALSLLLFYRNATRYKIANIEAEIEEDQPAFPPAEPEADGDIGQIIDDVDQEILSVTSTKDIPTVGEIHMRWSAAWRRYEAAARTPIPCTHDRGKPFGEALVQPRIRRGPRRGKRIQRPGKSRVRQLKEKLHSLEAITQALRDVDILLNRSLYQHQPELIAEAELSPHLWRHNDRAQRATKANHLSQHVYRKSQSNVSLGILSDHELQHYHSELLEDLDLAYQIAPIRAAMDIFLSPAPPSYPMVEPALFDDTRERAAYADALDALRRPVPKSALEESQADNLRSSKLNIAQHLHRAEKDATINLLRRESDLGERSLLPLEYPRSMRPPDMVPAFALLYKKELPAPLQLLQKYGHLTKEQQQQKLEVVTARGGLYHFVIVLAVHHNRYAFSGSHPADYFEPEFDDSYYYVSAPETPFSAPPDTSLIVLPLACGSDYQEELLHTLIERERAGQQARYANQGAASKNGRPSAHQRALEECLPLKAAIGSARVLIRQDGEGWYNIFVQCAVPVDYKEVPYSSSDILGIHLDGHQYYWSHIAADGTPYQHGRLSFSSHVLPTASKPWYSKNYAHEVANAIVELAEQRACGLVCIEETWHRRHSSTSHMRNRYAHSHPSATIAKYTKQKLLRGGWVSPQLVYGVSSQRCGACGNTERNARERRMLKACPSCGASRLSAYMQIPVAGRAVAVVTNLPGIVIRLTALTLAGIVWGQIIRWNDPAIQEDNPDIALPDLPITFICLPQNHWCTQSVSQYIQRQDDHTPHNQIHLDAPPTIYQAQDEEDVARLIQNTLGAIGYIYLRKALSLGLQLVAIQNTDGIFITPHEMSLYPGATSLLSEHEAEGSASLQRSIYPLGEYLWYLLTREQEDEQRAKALTDHLSWLILQGFRQRQSEPYLPLPQVLASHVMRHIGFISWEGRPVAQYTAHQSKSLLKKAKVRQVNTELRFSILSMGQFIYDRESSPNLNPHTSIEISYSHIEDCIDQIKRGEFDAVISNRVIDTDELNSVTNNTQNIYCLNCGQVWEPSPTWFLCGSSLCHTEILAAFNQAMTVAKLGKEQFIATHKKYS